MLQSALAKIKTGWVAGRARAAERLPEFEALRDLGRDIKNHTLAAHLDLYLEAFEARVAELGHGALGARRGGGARRSCSSSAGPRCARTVTKSKSMVTEEIGLNAFLESHGSSRSRPTSASTSCRSRTSRRATSSARPCT